MPAPFLPSDQSDTPTLRFSPFGEPLPSVAVKPRELVMHSQMARRTAVAGPLADVSPEPLLNALGRLATAQSLPEAQAIARQALQQAGHAMSADYQNSFYSSARG